MLLWLGQPVICTCGTLRLWVGEVSGPETSQQITDWYTFTHVLHGVGLYLVLWLIAPRAPISMRFLLALGVECAWEIVENTPLVIERYRQAALAQGYFGDSIVNSLSDTAAAIVRFGIARFVPVWACVTLFAAIELMLVYMVHDSLVLNVIQLIHPIEAIGEWQRALD